MEKQQLNLLLEALKNKKKFYEEILELTKKQNEVLQANELSKFDMSSFEALMADKDVYISKVMDYDEGFTSIFDQIKDELHSNQQIYVLEIRQMQGMIRALTELSIKIKNLEFKNKQLLDSLLAQEKQNITRFRKSQTIVSAYDRVMKKMEPQQSFFLDKKN